MDALNPKIMLQTEEKDLNEDVFDVTDRHLKGDTGTFADSDHEVSVDDLQRDYYPNETFSTRKHGKMTLHRSKRMAQPDDYEDIRNFYERRRKPDSDEEETEDNEKSTKPTKEGKRQNGSNKRNNNPPFNDSCEICGKMIGGRRLKSGALDRVINGKIVKPMNKYPWIVSLSKPDVGIFCGGAFISSTFVLTASHCLWHQKGGEKAECQNGNPPKDCFLKTNEIKIGLLSKRQSEKIKHIEIAEIIPHEQYDNAKVINDIALIKLASPLKCNRFSSTICLPPRDLNKFGGNLIVTGWGASTGEGKEGRKMLREGKMKQVKASVCKKLTKQFFTKSNNIICTIGAENKQSSCTGDSGTSVFGEFRNTIYSVGVTSRHSDSTCKTTMPMTSTKIFRYISWIKRYVKDLPKLKRI